MEKINKNDNNTKKFKQNFKDKTLPQKLQRK